MRVPIGVGVVFFSGLLQGGGGARFSSGKMRERGRGWGVCWRGGVGGDRQRNRQVNAKALSKLPLSKLPFSVSRKKSAKTKRGRPEGDGKKKRQDNLRQTSRHFTTFHGNLRHFMTISVSLFH